MNKTEKLGDFEQDLDCHNPHDKMFKQALYHKQAAISFIQHHAPEYIKKLIDTSTLKVEKGSFIEKDFKESACDVLLSAKIAGKEGYVLLLIEHQSKPDRWMAFRLMQYMLSICSRHLKEHPKSKYLPLVYVSVVYNGKARYTAPLNFWNLFEESDMAKKIWVEDHQLINVHETPDEDLAKMGEIGALEYFLKYWHEKNLLPVLEKAQKVRILPGLLKSEEGVKYFEILLHYLLTGIKKNDNMDLLKIIKSNLEENSMGAIAQRFETSLAKHWLNEGIEKGIEKGIDKRNHEIANNMLRAGSDITFISTVTGLSVLEIQKLKAKL
jgi:predicted transposase/invertase (TIGR01784 family)